MQINGEDSIKTTHSTKQIISAVGYGRITTPAGTFNQTLLIKTNCQILNTITSNKNSEIVTSNHSYIKYSWMQNDKKQAEILNLIFLKNAQGKDTLTNGYYTIDRNTTSTLNHNKNASFQMLTLSEDPSFIVQFSQLKTGIFKIYGMEGKEKISVKFEKKKALKIQTDILPAGVYLGVFESSGRGY